VARILVIVALFCLFSGCIELDLREALDKDDPKECEEIYADAHDDCYILYAEKRKDASFCNEVEVASSKNRCYSRVAQAKKDASLCLRITESSTILNSCVANIAEESGDIMPCINYLSDTGKSGCVRSVAKKLKDASLCDHLEVGGGFDGCIEAVAVAKHDASLCEKVSTQKGKTYCKASVAGTAPPADPAEGGFDPKDPDSGNGYTF
jgi:hypothetical protein